MLQYVPPASFLNPLALHHVSASLLSNVFIGSGIYGEWGGANNFVSSAGGGAVSMNVGCIVYAGALGVISVRLADAAISNFSALYVRTRFENCSICLYSGLSIQTRVWGGALALSFGCYVHTKIALSVHTTEYLFSIYWFQMSPCTSPRTNIPCVQSTQQRGVVQSPR